MLRNVYIGLLIWVHIIKLSQQEDCIRSQNLEPGKTYYLYNKDYPNRSTGSSCVFKMTAPEDYHVFINCYIETDTDGNNCGTEKFYISLDGDLRNAEVFCGGGVIERTSKFRDAAVAYNSTAAGGSAGGRFLCSVIAQPDSCECGWTQSLRIEGGEDAHEGEYPSVAGIVDVEKRLIYCGGTIISHRLVVSAKHCFAGVSISTIAVGVGIIQTTSGSKYGALYSIESFLFPPDCENRREPNDLALVKTSKNINWSNGVAPACLPFLQKNDTFVDKDVMLLGWGFNKSGRKNTVLQKVQVKVISNSNCSSYYPSISANEMCTYAPGKDACQMDSGGPVLYVKERQILVGIIGYGRVCGEGDPGVNTRVTSYVDWIKSVSDEELCQKKFH